jgi:phosphoribosylformylglycinamidine synthase
MYKANIYVTIREGVIDPQGKALQEALVAMGYQETRQVKVGKFIELTIIAANDEEAAAKVTAICDKLLANANVEDYRFELEVMTA